MTKGRCVQMFFFTVPALDARAAQDEMNRFCATQRVVAVERQFVACGPSSFWAICVQVASGAGALPEALKAPEKRSGERSAAERVDYKEVLGEADFARFADLRVWRKSVAEHEGVPVYAVFTNEQLAEIARRRID